MPNQYNNKGRTKQVIVRLNDEEDAELRELAWRARAKSPADYVRGILALKSTARLEARHAKAKRAAAKEARSKAA